MSSDEINKEALYGDYMRGQKWRDKLFRKGCYKTLDIPDDDMQINNHQQGLAGRHVVALFGLALAAAVGWKALEPIEPGPTVSLPAQSSSVQFNVEFWADDGTEINVEQ